MLVIAMLLFLLSSCNTTKFLEEDQILLDKVETGFSKDSKVKKPGDLKSELIQFYKQKPNGNFLFVPREWYWFKNQDPGDTSWIKKWSKKSLGEEPAFLDTTKIQMTTQDMQNYLRNKKGYYNAEVKDTIQYKDKRAYVKYTVNPKQRYTINSLEYLSRDSTIVEEIDSLYHTSFLKIGDPLDALTFDLEKQRIVNSMQNIGYANFNLNHVVIKGDSTELNHAWDVFVEVLPPGDTITHKRYRVGEIDVFTDFHQFQNFEDLQDTFVFGKTYLRQSKDFIIKPSIIDRKIFLKTDQIFRSDLYDKTVRKLFNLQTYRFVKLQPYIIPEKDSLINYRILLTPQRNKWVFDFGTDVFFSSISQNLVDRNLVGFSFGTGIENRNAFKSGVKYKFSLEAGVELRVETQEINTFSLGVNNSFEIPQFTKPLNIISLGNKLGLVKDKAFKTIEEESSSKINIGSSYIDIFQNYEILSLNTTYGYDIRFNKKHRLVFNQIGFNYAAYEIRDSFDMIINNNQLLQRSFQTTFFTGLLFKDLSYYYQSDRGLFANNYGFIANIELSGLELHAANKLTNALTGSDRVWRLNNEVNFEKFIKLQLDGRWSRNLNKGSSLAARIKGGISIPYGRDENGETNVVSFIKQFLVGGPSSIRAWRPMELGPGSYQFPDPNPISFFQRGDLLLEFNLEYRFDLFWLLDGALFFDGGNIWTLKEDPDRVGSQFGPNFMDQIALGYGWGMRFDFTYFLIRFDFGYKLRSPFEIDGSHFVPLSGQGLFGNFNVAVNYPF